MDSKKSLSPAQKTIVGVQFLFVAFGATVLVPLLVGLDPSTALFTAGLGTLIFHLVTKGKVPIFLGSSFAFVAPIIKATELYGLPGTMSGLVAVGAVYGLMSALVKWRGIGFIKTLFPPVVIGPVIILIGLSLAGSGVNMAKENWPLALIALLTAILASLLGKGMIKLIPIFCGIIVGYIAGAVFGVIDFEPIVAAPWFAFPQFVKPELSWGAVIFMIPVTIAPIIEHIGDVYAINEVTGKDFVKDPGLHRTMLGDGLACVADRRTSCNDLFGSDWRYLADKDHRPYRYPYCCGDRYCLFCLWEDQCFSEIDSAGRVGRNNVVAVRYDCGCRYKQPDTKPDESGRYTQPDYCFADPYLRHRWRSN